MRNFHAAFVPPQSIVAIAGSVVFVFSAADVFRGAVPQEFAGIGFVHSVCALAGLGIFQTTVFACFTSSVVDNQLLRAPDDVWAGYRLPDCMAVVDV